VRSTPDVLAYVPISGRNLRPVRIVRSSLGGVNTCTGGDGAVRGGNDVRTHPQEKYERGVVQTGNVCYTYVRRHSRNNTADGRLRGQSSLDDPVVERDCPDTSCMADPRMYCTGHVLLVARWTDVDRLWGRFELLVEIPTGGQRFPS